MQLPIVTDARGKHASRDRRKASQGPGRQMVVIRLDATKCIFWNFKSPEKICWFPRDAGCPKYRGRLPPAQSQAALDKQRTLPQPNSLLSEAYPPTISLVIHLFIQQPSYEQRMTIVHTESGVTRDTEASKKPDYVSPISFRGQRGHHARYWGTNMGQTD